MKSCNWVTLLSGKRMRTVEAAGVCARSGAILLCIALGGLGLPANTEAKGVKWDEPVTAVEMRQLPQYCLWNFNRNKPEYQAPQFRVDKVFPNCGNTGTNFIHFCNGIKAMVRANRPGAGERHRRYWIGRAGAEFRRTANEIKPWPSCGVREPLNAYLKQLEVISKTRR